MLARRGLGYNLVMPSLELPLERYAPSAERQIVRFRWLAVVYVLLIANGLTPHTANVGWFNWLAVTAVVYNGTLDLLLRHGFWRPWLPYLTASLDVLYCMVGSALTGGVASDIRYLYFLSPVTVALRFNLRTTCALSLADTLTFALLALPGGIAPVEWQAIGVFALSINFIALVVGILAEHVIRSRDHFEAMVSERTIELAAATAELRTANEHLRHLDQLKTDFLNTVTHELRTPLTAIRGYTEFLEDEVGGPLSPDQKTFTEQIRQGTARLQHLVDDLLDVARLEAGTLRLNLREADLRLKIEEVLKSLVPLAKAKGIELVSRIPEDLPPMRMDPERVGQILINLVGNALKFTPPGGKVRIEARVQPEEVRVAVSDTGVGIAPEHLPHLFEKFYRVDPSLTRETGGAGLGLSIVQSLVQAHGGSLGADSEPGAGSTFWFRLPRPEAE